MPEVHLQVAAATEVVILYIGMFQSVCYKYICSLQVWLCRAAGIVVVLGSRVGEVLWCWDLAWVNCFGAEILLG